MLLANPSPPLVLLALFHLELPLGLLGLLVLWLLLVLEDHLLLGTLWLL